MRLFLNYLHARRGILLLILLCCAVFTASFALYHLPLSAVLYPSLLSLILTFALLTADFCRVRSRRLTLERLAESLDSLPDALPVPDGPAEEDYQSLIRALCEEQTRFKSALSLRYDEMTDYYTLWAHQIKTPIAAMRLTLQNEDSPISRRLLGELFRIEQYVDMVMTFLRLDSDSTDYVLRECDPDLIVRGAVKKFAGEFISRRISLDYSPIACRIVTDEKWLSFVVEQLLSNALKYTPAGSISIYAEGEDTLCIKDTGIGIAPEDLPRIFEKGYTGRNGREDKKASGIGLYLCKRICKNLGCTLSAESQPGEGTLIRLGFPKKRKRLE